MKSPSAITYILHGVACLMLHSPCIAFAQGQYRDIEFTNTPAPVTAEEMSQTYTRSEIILTHPDGKQTRHSLSYEILFKNTDKIATNKYAAGQYYDFQGNARLDSKQQPIVSEAPDGNSLLVIDNRLYLLTHFEYDWIDSSGTPASNSIMSIALTELKQTTDGKLTAVSQRNVDTSSVGGILAPCFASQTPWGTHLASEENYYFDALFSSPYARQLQKNISTEYFNDTRTANPYHYGFIPEISIDKAGNTHIVKHYAMGRGAWEMAYVMPDSKTVYLGDDGANKPLIMFIADSAGDLSAGTLYAARWHQLSETKGGSARIEWIWLGHSSNARLAAIADTLTFKQIFSMAAKPDTQHITLKTGTTRHLHLSVNKDMHEAAAFFETERYAAYRGATTEFNKIEGISYNPQTNELYVAISSINDGMTVNEGVTEHISVKAIKAGGVYTLSLDSHSKDTEGKKIDSRYVATAMHALLTGVDTPVDQYGNTASIAHIANPDNIFYSAELETLFISEDSKQHVNNFLWAYSPRKQRLSRILTLTAGAESSGLQVTSSIHGHRYIMSNTQHHGEALSNIPAPLRVKIAPLIDKHTAYIGYLAGIPGSSVRGINNHP